MYNSNLILLVRDIFNNMENKNMTEQDIQSIASGDRSVAGRNGKEVRSVVNLFKAMEFLQESVANGRGFDREFIVELHEIIMEGISKSRGVYRFANESRFACGIHDCKKVEPRLNQFIENYHKRAAKYNTPNFLVYLAAYMHLEIMRIRPFNDGNCRLATLLMNYVLMCGGKNPISINEEVKETYYCFTRLYSARKVIQPMVDIILLRLKDGGFDINQ